MSSLAGTRGLIRLILRRDRWRLLWVLLPAAAVTNFATATKELYPDAADRAEYAATTGTNSGFLAMFGPLYGTDTGALVAQRAAFAPAILALITLLTVIRHTRTDEERGRTEVLGATAVGRHAFLAAALIVTMAGALAAGVLAAFGLIGQDLPASGAFSLGLSIALVGCVFAAVGAVAAQLTQSAAAARGIALGTLGGAYLIRLIGDAGGAGNDLTWVSWLSPLGWAHLVRSFADERWWVLALPVAFITVLVTLAVMVAARRDVGAGLVQPRPGPAVAGADLRGPDGLAWRLHRGSLLAWTAGFLVFGIGLGGVADGVGELVRDNPDIGDLITRAGGQTALVDAYLAAMMSLMAVIAAGFAIQAALRLRSEEDEQRAEPVLATAVTRLRWAAGHVAFAVLGPAVALCAIGLAVGLVHGLNTGDVGGELPSALGGALVQLPAVWLLAGLAVAMFGWLPRVAAAVTWGVLALCLVFGQLGAMLELDQWLLDLSPFTHIPRLPGGDFSAEPLAWLLAVTAILMAIGLAAFRRRDVPIA